MFMITYHTSDQKVFEGQWQQCWEEIETKDVNKAIVMDQIVNHIGDFIKKQEWKPDTFRIEIEFIVRSYEEQVQWLPFTLERISDVLCCALDSWYGSSYYWCKIVQRISPTAWEFDSGAEDHCHYGYDYALNPDGALVIISQLEEEKQEYRLDLDAIRNGLKIMDMKYHAHFEDIEDENEDAVTGDVLLQCCLFGEVIYG